MKMKNNRTIGNYDVIIEDPETKDIHIINTCVLEKAQQSYFNYMSNYRVMLISYDKDNNATLLLDNKEYHDLINKE